MSWGIKFCLILRLSGHNYSTPPWSPCFWVYAGLAEVMKIPTVQGVNKRLLKVQTQNFSVGLFNPHRHFLGFKFSSLVSLASGGCRWRPAAHMVQITSNKTERVVYVMKTEKEVCISGLCLSPGTRFFDTRPFPACVQAEGGPVALQEVRIDSSGEER